MQGLLVFHKTFYENKKRIVDCFRVHDILSSFMTYFVDISLKCEKIMIAYIVLSYQ